MVHQWLRWLRHLWTEDAHRKLPAGLSDRVAQRIAHHERTHSGEICVCIESALPSSYLLRPESVRALLRQRAVAQFSSLRVWDTEDNNGMLIYLCLAERSIELVADRSIHRYVGEAHWATLVASLGGHLRQGRWEEGLHTAIDSLSGLLHQHFPLTPAHSNPNELPDTPTIL